jgi:hypothetical protein
MLEPGTKMLKVIGLLLLLSILVKSLHLNLVYYLCLGIIGIIGALLFIMLLIEQHQDEVLNQQALEERKKFGDE